MGQMILYTVSVCPVIKDGALKRAHNNEGKGECSKWGGDAMRHGSRCPVASVESGEAAGGASKGRSRRRMRAFQASAHACVT